jgi:Flp pilus assembly protein TadB
MIGTGHRRPAETTEHSVGELVKQASEQLSTLVRQEMRLAQAEMVQKGKRAGIGGGMFGGAAAVAFVSFLAFATAAIAALSLVLPVWAAALIVAGGLLVMAGVLALMGKKQVGRATPPTPEQAIRGMKADVEVIRERVRR